MDDGRCRDREMHRCRDAKDAHRQGWSGLDPPSPVAPQGPGGARSPGDVGGSCSVRLQLQLLNFSTSPEGREAGTVGSL